MTRFFPAAVVTSILIALGALPVSAETVAHPKGSPLFTVEVPEGWAFRQSGGGPLMMQNADVSVVAVFDGAIKGVKNLATAKEAVRKQIKLTAETTGYTDLTEITSVRGMKLNEEIDGAGAQYSAKLPSGEPVIYLVMMFAPDGKNYCSMEFSIKRDGLLPAAEKERDALIESISAVKAESEAEE
jgi:hypothetical protein